MLQCSCLENPRDGGAWWAAISGVTQGRTQLKQFSISGSMLLLEFSYSMVFFFFKRSILRELPADVDL